MKFQRTSMALAIAGAFTLINAAHADEPTPLADLQVTATRDPEPVAKVPASITIVSGDELRARGANDLRTALALVAGVEGTPGGDAGPASAVPSLWGLREQDAYLLVVDGVPWGGAFNPATPSIDLNGVERIEVLRGAAPVMFGATSFVGVIHVIHYAAGTGPRTVSAWGGSYGTYGASASMPLPAIGAYKQSLAATIEKRGYSVDDQEFQRYNLMYRGASSFGGVNWHVDGDVSVLPQTPGNVIFRNGPNLRTDILDEDANHNPSDARLDQTRVHLATGLDGNSGLGTWAVTLAATRTFDDILRGFLRDYAPTTGEVANADPADPTVCPGPDAPDGKCDPFDADGYAQKRQLTDVYFDAHFDTRITEAFDLTWGVDYQYGKGKQHATNFGYFVSLDGNDAPRGADQHADEIVASDDTRHFYGAYAQLDWKAAERLDVIAGLRLNHTREETTGSEILNDADQMELHVNEPEERTKTRLAGVIGASYEAWRSGNDTLSVYGDYRNTYKPLAVDFGPEAETDILEPETANSYEVGAKGRLLDAALEYDVSLFRMDFRNMKTINDAGDTVNAGKTRFQGVETEARYALLGDLKLAASYAYHDARFVRFNRGPGQPVDGNRFETSPYHLISAGLMFFPAQGFQGALIWNHTGQRFLNKSNSLSVGGYNTLDATAGWRFGKFGVNVNGYNLTDRRDVVSESELAEEVSGASSYYLLPARLITVGVSMDL